MKPQAARRGFTLVEILVVLLVLTVLGALAASALLAVRQAADRCSCANNVRQLIIAVDSRRCQTGVYPLVGGATYEDWSLSVLTAVEQGNILEQFDRQLPPGDDANLAAARIRPALLTCPSRRELPLFETWIPSAHYGMNGELAGETACDTGTASTVLISEAPMEPAFAWVVGPGISTGELGSIHHGVNVIGYVDGHVEFRALPRLQSTE